MGEARAAQQVKEKDSQALFCTHIYYDSESKISIFFFSKKEICFTRTFSYEWPAFSWPHPQSIKSCCSAWKAILGPRGDKYLLWGLNRKIYKSTFLIASWNHHTTLDSLPLFLIKENEPPNLLIPHFKNHFLIDRKDNTKLEGKLGKS